MSDGGHGDTDPGRLCDLFDAVSELPAEARRVELSRLAPGEPELQRQVEQMLAASEEPIPALDAVRALTSIVEQWDDHPERPGDRLGDYVLVEPLNDGAFGRVWLARQMKPIEQDVAVKFLGVSAASSSALTRFLEEGPNLALMRHPNIARAIVADTTSEGRPYLVMELVRGESIVSYCERHGLSFRERLGLFQQVCRAVGHVHSKGLIHRDLKPDNVLVEEFDGRHVAKLIDFGIAKQVDRTDGSRTLQEHRGGLLGSVGYMSPEQVAEPWNADARADVYSLGVMLFEMLLGFPLIDRRALSRLSLAQLVDMSLRFKPRAPSRYRRVRKLAARYRLGDLDAVLGKALARRPFQRYRTAAELADDVGRLRRRSRVQASAVAGGIHRWLPATPASRALACVLLFSVCALGLQLVVSSRTTAEGEALAANGRHSAGALSAPGDSPPTAAPRGEQLQSQHGASGGGNDAHDAPAQQPDGTELQLAPLARTLTDHPWHYFDSLYPPGDRVRFTPVSFDAGRFHSRWNWTFRVVDGRGFVVDFWDDGRQSDLLMRFNRDLTEAQGRFEDPQGRVHVIRLSRIEEGPQVEGGPPPAPVILSPHLDLAAHDKKVGALKFSEDEESLYSGGNSTSRWQEGRIFRNEPGRDNTVRVWAVQTGDQVGLIRRGLGQRYSWHVHGIENVGDGDAMAVTTCRPDADWGDATLSIWDRSTLRRLGHFALGGRPGAWAPFALPDGDVGVVRGNGSLQVVHAGGSRSSLRSYDLVSGRGEHFVMSAVGSPASGRIFLGCRDGAVRSFLVEDFSQDEVAFDHDDPVRVLGLSGDGQVVLSGSRTDQIVVSASGDLTTVKRISLEANAMAATFVGATGALVAVATSDRLSVWSLVGPTPEMVAEVDCDDDRGGVTCMTGSDSGRFLAVGYSKGSIIVWRVETGE